MGTYRLHESYETNYQSGPDFHGPWPEIPKTPVKDLLGYPVASKLGIAAGLLLNSRWIACYARLGFDLLTYKTVRSVARACYPPPNWVRIAGPLPDDPKTSVTTVEPPVTEDHADNRSASWAVCFGMPSMAPEIWRADVEKSRHCLKSGQVLIVSVVGTPQPGMDDTGLAEDFARCAAWAVESGAQMIEANFSCPNVCSAEGQLYLNADAAHRVALRLRQAIGKVPLLIKSGSFSGREPMRRFLAALDHVADAVVLVNCVQRRVLRPDGQTAFGAFERVGVLGPAIHAAGVELVRGAVDIIRQQRLPLQVWAVGGAADINSIRAYFQAGASVVMMGSAPMVAPTLAVEIKNADPSL